MTLAKKNKLKKLASVFSIIENILYEKATPCVHSINQCKYCSLQINFYFICCDPIVASELHYMNGSFSI